MIDANSNYRMPIGEAYAKGLLPVFGITYFDRSTFHCSSEYIQDTNIKIKSLTAIRTPEFTEEEIKDWREMDEVLCKCDLDNSDWKRIIKLE